MKRIPLFLFSCMTLLPIALMGDYQTAQSQKSYVERAQEFIARLENTKDSHHNNTQLINELKKWIDKAPRDSTMENPCPNACCASLENIEILINQLLVQGCRATPLSSAPVTLNTAGATYCLTQNVTGTITIDNNHITLLLNGHIVNGSVVVTDNGDHATIVGGTVTGDVPTNNSDADFGAIHIDAGAICSNIFDCMLDCVPTVATDVNGLTAINNAAPMLTVARSVIHAGDAGPSDTLNAVAGTGIVNTANNSSFIYCSIAGGNGPDSTDGTKNTSSGGAGLNSAGNEVNIVSVQIIGGHGGNITTTGDIANGVALTTGDGGAGIIASGFVLMLNTSAIYGGTSGSVTSTTGSVAINSGGSVTIGKSGDGVFITNAFGIFIDNITSATFPSGSVTANGNIATDGGTVTINQTGTGLLINPGFGIALKNSFIAAQGSGNVMSQNGLIGTSGGSVTIDHGGDAISIAGDAISIEDTRAVANTSGFVQTLQTAATGASIAVDNVTINRGGITLSCDSGSSLFFVKNCNFLSGAGGPIQAANGSISNTVFAGSAGADINIQADSVDVFDCVFAAQSGGSVMSLDSTAGVTNLGTSGDGANAIYVTSSRARIRNCSIDLTGQGGNTTINFPAAFTPSGTGGNGGDGIHITSNAAATEVNNCIISFTGQAGSGAISGTPGIAINDLSSSSVIFTNFAYNIAGSPQYVLGATAAIDAPNGTTFLAAGTNNLENIFKP